MADPASGKIALSLRRVAAEGFFSTGALGFLEQVIELFGGTRVEQLLANRVLSDETRYPAQRLDVRTGRGFGADEHEQQSHGLAIERVVFDGCCNGPGGHSQFRHDGRFAVRNRDAVADARREYGLTLAYRAEYVVVDLDVIGGDDQFDHLAQEGVLARRAKRNADSIYGQQVRQEQKPLPPVLQCPEG